MAKAASGWQCIWGSPGGKGYIAAVDVCVVDVKSRQLWLWATRYPAFTSLEVGQVNT